MSPTADRFRRTLLSRLRPRRREDEGFTLVEVLVALMLFALAASATASMIVTGLRASLVAKLDTGAKNLAQERVELMRNLPFHIDHDPAAAPGADRDDLLNNYYPNLAGATSATTSGFVGGCGTETATCAGRQPWDPPAGSFYRVVINPVPGYPKYRQYITTQFLDEQRQSLRPATGYNSEVAGSDTGPSQLVGVTVTTYWTAGTLTKSYQVQTYIAAGRPAASQVAVQGRSTSIRLTSGLNSAQLLTLVGGSVSLDGALSSGTIAAAEASGGMMELTAGAREQGALLSASAPPNATLPAQQLAAKTLYGPLGNPLGFLGTTQAADVAVSVTNAQPATGTDTTPVRGAVMPQGPGQIGLAYTNNPNNAYLALSSSMPLAWIVQANGGQPIAEARGYTKTVGGVSHSTTATVNARTLALRMFSTSFAPEGVVQVSLDSSALNCTANGQAGGATASLTYGGTVRYWRHGVGYVTVSLSAAAGSDPLASVPLNTTQVGVSPAGGPLFLSDYIAGWTSLTSGGVSQGIQAHASGDQVTAAYNGLINVTTQPTRAGDTTSSISAQLGLLSCIAEDNR